MLQLSSQLPSESVTGFTMYDVSCHAPIYKHPCKAKRLPTMFGHIAQRQEACQSAPLKHGSAQARQQDL